MGTSDTHDYLTCPTCQAVLFGEPLGPGYEPQGLLGMSPIAAMTRRAEGAEIVYATTTPSPSFGALLKHLTREPEAGPPWVHTFTWPEEDEPEDSDAEG